MRLATLAGCGLGVALCLAGGACTTRTIRVTSEPAGAEVVVNDVPVGRTPTSFEFTFYGVYDVLLTKEGYEPLRVRQPARAPWYEYPPADLAALGMPGGVRTTRAWHFTLEPSLDRTLAPVELERALMERARTLRSSSDSGRPVDKDQLTTAPGQ